MAFLNINTEAISSSCSDSSIIVVDDQFVNQQAVRLSFQELGLADRLTIFSNGEELIESLQNLLEERKVSDLA